jgi:hypothetical protein
VTMFGPLMGRYGYGKHGVIEVVIIRLADPWNWMDNRLMPWKCDKHSTLSTCNFVQFTQILVCARACVYIYIYMYTHEGFLSTVIMQFQVIIATTCQPLMWCKNIKLSSRSWTSKQSFVSVLHVYSVCIDILMWIYEL